MLRPEPTSRHPLVVFLLALCIIQGLAVVFGSPAPNSVEEQLDYWQVETWGWALFLGGTLFATGVYFQPSDEAPHLATGILLEQLGSAFLGAAGVLYGLAIWATAGWVGALPGGIVLAMGLACVYRWRSIQKHVRRMKKVPDGS